MPKRKAHCFGQPGVDAACRRCGNRIECFERRNKRSEWQLLVKPSIIESFRITELEKLPDFDELVTKEITISGAKRLGFLAYDVDFRIRSQHPFIIERLPNNRVVWRLLQKKKKGKGHAIRAFVEVVRARSEIIELRLAKKTPLLERHFLSPHQKKRAHPILKADPRNEKATKNLAFLLSIALQELMGTLPNL